MSSYLAVGLNTEVQLPISPLILCDGRLVLCSSNSSELVATVLPVPTTHALDDSIDSRSALLAQEVDTDDLDIDNVGFCPMSGRLVWTISEAFLQVLDFLPPLGER